MWFNFLLFSQTHRALVRVCFILKGRLSSCIIRANDGCLDAARLCESPAVALSSHRQRRAESRRIHSPMDWKLGITVDHSGSFRPRKSIGAKMEWAGFWYGWGCCIFEWDCCLFGCGCRLGRRQHRDRKKYPELPRHQRGELGFSTLCEVSVCRLWLAARTAHRDGAFVPFKKKGIRL